MRAITFRYLAQPDRVSRQLLEDAGVADPGIPADRQESRIEAGDALVLSRVRDRRRPDNKRRPTSIPCVPEHAGEVRPGVRSGHPLLSGPLLDSGVVDPESHDDPAVTAGRQSGGALQPPSVRDLPTGLAAHPQRVRGQRQPGAVCACGNTSYPAQVVRVADAGDEGVPHNTHPQVRRHQLSMPRLLGSPDVATPGARGSALRPLLFVVAAKWDTTLFRLPPLSGAPQVSRRAPTILSVRPVRFGVPLDGRHAAHDHRPTARQLTDLANRALTPPDNPTT